MTLLTTYRSRWPISILDTGRAAAGSRPQRRAFMRVDVVEPEDLVIGAGDQ
jgi:hypothetical protein